MTVNQLRDNAKLETICLADGEREIDGAYTGDLLSWVMGNAKYGNAWVTIMTNQNIIAVATLIDVSCVIVAENSEISDETASLAREKCVNLLRSPLPSYELCALLSRMIEQ